MVSTTLRSHWMRKDQKVEVSKMGFRRAVFSNARTTFSGRHSRSEKTASRKSTSVFLAHRLPPS
eukprot:2380028-Pleurochrysis_carterae.AAC.1